MFVLDLIYWRLLGFKFDRTTAVCGLTLVDWVVRLTAVCFFSSSLAISTLSAPSSRTLRLKLSFLDEAVSKCTAVVVRDTNCDVML
jgi:hypothetical protein